ncbi:MAG: CsgG/HfaB family protein [Treponema sp.]|jgi:curli biogenesis system outer membrane secretion channel CsgG|nr:CsgG/HfaB family protein [Treponema sp.]
MNNAAEIIMNSLQKNSRMAIVNVSSSDRDLSEFVAGELEYILVTNRFMIVDRSELDRIRREQNFQLSGDVDDGTIVSIGKFAGADVVITGAITGTGETRRLRLRALNTQTAQVMAVASEHF